MAWPESQVAGMSPLALLFVKGPVANKRLKVTVT
jgi:hypothetical protein